MSPVRRDVGAAAELDRVGAAVLADAHGDDADLVAVLLAEEGHRTLGDGGVAVDDADARFLVAAEVEVHLGLDQAQLVGASPASAG